MKAEVHLPPLMRRITIQAKITGVKRTKLRVWFGCKIMMLAAAVMGCNIEVNIEP